MKDGGDFGKLRQLEVRGEEKRVRLLVDGKENGERPWALGRWGWPGVPGAARWRWQVPGRPGAHARHRSETSR